MNKNHLTAIVFTVSFALTVAITFGSAFIGNNNGENTVLTPDTTKNNNGFVDSEIDNSNLTESLTTNTHIDILDQILDQFASYDTVFSWSNVGGNNVNGGGFEYILDGETVTTVFETETTGNGEETSSKEDTTAVTKPAPEVTDKEPVTVIPEETTILSPSTETDTEPATEPETTDTSIDTDSEIVTDTDVDVDTTVAETYDTTTVTTEADNTEEITEPVDNSQAEIFE